MVTNKAHHEASFGRWRRIGWIILISYNAHTAYTIIYVWSFWVFVIDYFECGSSRMQQGKQNNLKIYSMARYMKMCMIDSMTCYISVCSLNINIAISFCLNFFSTFWVIYLSCYEKFHVALWNISNFTHRAERKKREGKILEHRCDYRSAVCLVFLNGKM